MKFRDLSIERKLTLIITISTAVALVTASSILITRSAHTAYEQMIEDLATLADIVGNTSKAALSFRDATDAKEILGSLKGKSSITAACVYDANNHIFATYSSPSLNRPFEPPLPQQDGYRMDQGRIIMFRQIRQNEEILGTLYLESELRQLQEAIRRNIVQAILITIGSILLASLLASRLQHLILRQINRVVLHANAIAKGELPEHLPVDSNDEIGELQQSFNQMIDTTRNVVRQTQTLAHGDYSITIEPRSEQDELSLALIKMTGALKSFHEESRKQNWIKTGLGELYDRMRGEQKLEDLLDNILSSLAEYLGVQVGALFLADEDGQLVVAGGYAYSAPRNSDRVFRFGEGLVGQAAQERKLISAKDDTGSSFVIKSGLIDTMPRHIVVLPLIREEEVIGVLELGTSSEFNKNDLELLEQAAGAIAIAIFSAQSRMRLNSLLERTQEQSEKLRDQQSALQKTNEELEERTKLLEQQKQEIHRSNHDLETARLDLERKARELATASQYKSEFLANMSHELRTPLNSLLILSRLLAENREGNLTEKQIEFSTTINKSGSDLLALINDILDLSKVEAGKLDFHIDTVSVAEFCTSMEGMFRHVAEEKNAEFRIIIEEDAPLSIRTDPQRVSQILRNLLSNAFKFTPEGSVSLRVYAPPASALNDAEGGIAFDVVDSGIGIPEDKQADIFHAFQQADGTTSREYGGTGLGLSISRELAVRLGGNITLKSSEGAGSTFTLCLPAEAPDSSDMKSTMEQMFPTVGSGVLRDTPPQYGSEVTDHPSQLEDDREKIREDSKTILLIEDDAKFARILMDIAHDHGFFCIVAQNGTDGLALAREFKPGGIILDIMLPGMDGRAVMQKLKEDVETRAIPVYIISVLDQDQESMRMGAVGFLTKPVSMEQVNHAFERVEDVMTRHHRKLLVVEDDPASAEGIAMLFADTGVEVVVADSGAKALEELNTSVFDCVILDLHLGDMSGMNVLEEFDREHKDAHVPIIVYTGRDLSWNEEARLRRSVESIIIKGEDALDQLMERASLYMHLRDIERKAEPDIPIQPSSVEEVDMEAMKGTKVLIVDDDMRNAYSLAAVLDREGIGSVLASEGEKAVSLLESEPDIGLVLMDIMMPGMDGYDAIRAIRKQSRFKTLPIIALTAKAMKGDREKCIEAGANDYLSKPVDMNGLMLKMSEWLSAEA